MSLRSISHCIIQWEFEPSICRELCLLVNEVKHYTYIISWWEVKINGSYSQESGIDEKKSQNPFITIHVLRNCISPLIRNRSNIILSSRSQECNIIKK